MAQLELAPGLMLNVEGDAPKNTPVAKEPKAEKPLTITTTPEASPKGLRRSFFDSFNNDILSLPDNVINLMVAGAEQAGLVNVEKDRKWDPVHNTYEDNRNFLRRIFNAGSYKEKEYLMGLIPMGKGAEQQPTTALDKIAAAGGSAAAIGAGFAAGAGSAAAKAPMTTPEIVDALNQAYSGQGSKALGHLKQTGADVVNSYKNSPLLSTGAEVASNVSSAALGQGEEELIGFRSGVGDLVGGAPGQALKVAGKGIAALSPTVTVARKAAEKAPAIVNFLKDRYTTKGIASYARNSVRDALESAYAHAVETGDLKRTNEIMQRFKEAGLEPPEYNAAQQTLDPALLQEVNRLNSQARGAEARRNQDVLNTNLDRINGFVDGIASNASGSVRQFEAAPSYVVDHVKGAADAELRGLEGEFDELDELARNNARRLPTVGRRDAEGDRIRAAIVEDKAAAQKEMDELADNLGINRKGPMRGVQGIKQEIADKFFQNNSVLQEGVPKIIRKIANMDESKMNFQEWKDFRGLIGDELSYALGNDQKDKVRQLMAFKKYWDDIGDRSFGELGENWNTFKQAYQERLVPYEKGVAHRITTKSIDSRPGDVRYTTADEQVADAFFGGVEEAKDFMNLTQNRPDAREAMRNVVLDKAREFAQPGRNNPFAGGLDPNKLNSFVAKNREVLQELDLYDLLTDVRSTQEALLSRNAALQSRREAIANDSFYKTLNKYAKGDTDAETILDQALTNRAKMNSLKTAVQKLDDPDVMASFREAVITRLVGDKTLLQENPDKFLDILRKNGSTLEMALGREHLEDLKLAVDGYKRALAGTENITGGGLSEKSLPEKIRDLVGTSPESALAQVRSAQRGHTNAFNVTAYLGARFMSNQQRKAFDRLMLEALRNPDIAADLAREVDPATKKPSAVVHRRLKAWMFNLGLQPEGDPKEEPQTIELTPTLPQSAPAPSPAPKLPQSSPAPGPSAPPFRPVDPMAPTPAQNPAQAPQAPRALNAYGALFPHDDLGVAIAGRQGFADGGFATDGMRVSENVEDRREDPPELSERTMALIREARDIQTRRILNNYARALAHPRSPLDRYRTNEFVLQQMQQTLDGYKDFQPSNDEERFRGEMGMLLQPHEEPKPRKRSKMMSERTMDDAWPPKYAEGGEVKRPFPGLSFRFR